MSPFNTKTVVYALMLLALLLTACLWRALINHPPDVTNLTEGGGYGGKC